jgi:acyl carrier protein
MTAARETRHQDVETIVIQKFQDHLGISVDLPLASRLYADLGLDSITLVATLLDITDYLQLDLRRAQEDLNTIQTLGEVISLIRSLQQKDDDRVS